MVDSSSNPDSSVGGRNGNTPDLDIWPLDASKLHKGDEIQADQIATIFGVAVDDPNFWAKKLSLSAWIESTLAAAGRPATVVCRGDAVRILTDAEAVEATARQFDAGLRKILRNNRRAQHVDVAALDSGERAKHERNLISQGAYIAAIVRVSHELRLTPTASRVPLPRPPKARPRATGVGSR